MQPAAAPARGSPSAVVQPSAAAVATTTTSAPALVKAAVAAPATSNQAPTAVNDGPFTVTKNTPLTLTAAQLVGNDVGAPGDTLAVNFVGGASNGTVVLNSNGTVTYTPTTNFTGAASFIYNVKDLANGLSSSNFATVSLNVTASANQAPTAVNQGPFTVTNNTPLTLTSAQLLANDTTPNAGATLSVNSVSSATNGTAVLNSNGTVTFTPTTGYSGAASFGYNVKDTTGAVSNTATVSLTVAAPVNHAPTAVNQGPFTVTNNTPLTLTSAQLLANDTTPNAGATLSVNSVSGATNGTAVLNSNGTVTFTPTTGYSGAASFGYNVKDTTGAVSNTATVSLAVAAPVTSNQAPTAVNDGPFTVTKNTPLTLTSAQLVGNDIGAPGDTLSVNFVGGASNGTAVLNSNGTVTFTPTTNFTGAASFIYNVRDVVNGLSSSNFATVSLAVTAPVGQAPTAVNQGPFTVTNNTPLTLTSAQLLANDTTPNAGATLSVNSVSAASNGTAVLNSNGTVTFTPTTGYSGAASFGYNVKDTTGAVSNTATVSLTVAAPVNQAPTAVNQGPFTVTNNTPLTLTSAQLLANDTTPNAGATLSVNSVSSATNGTAVLNSNGTVTFTPTTGYSGAASFGYNVKDTTGAVSNTATVSLTVAAPVNHAPTAVNQGPFTVTNNTPLTLTSAQLLANDTTPNAGATLSVNSVSGATNGTAVLNANGTVTFTPTTGYSGAASFGYNVKDTTGAVSNTATVSLTVAAPVTSNQAPTAVNDGPFTVTKNTPLTLTSAQLVGNDIGAPGDTLSVNFVGGASNGTVVLNSNGTVTYTPTTNFTGAASFIYNVRDVVNGLTSSNFATVSLTVTAPVGQAPTAVNQGPFTVTNNTPVTLTAAQLAGQRHHPQRRGDAVGELGQFRQQRHRGPQQQRHRHLHPHCRLHRGRDLRLQRQRHHRRRQQHRHRHHGRHPRHRRQRPADQHLEQRGRFRRFEPLRRDPGANQHRLERHAGVGRDTGPDPHTVGRY